MFDSRCSTNNRNANLHILELNECLYLSHHTLLGSGYIYVIHSGEIMAWLHKEKLMHNCKHCKLVGND